MFIFTVLVVETSPKFGAWVVGSFSGVLGLKYLTGGAFALLGEDVASSLLVQNMGPLTLTCGLLLCVITGAFLDGSRWARGGAILAFAIVGGLSIPAMLRLDPVIITEAVGMTVSILYLFVRNPIKREDVNQVDDSDSASKYGSTFR